LNANKKVAAAPTSSKSYDIVPGGYYNAQEEITADGGWASVFKPSSTSNLMTRTRFTLYNPNHCFIPTFSALGMDITNKDLSENLYNRDLTCTGETPFQAYYAPMVNQEHITLTAENVAWIKKEIDSIPQMSTVNYAALYPMVKTAGSDPVCTTATYQVNNLPGGSTIAWQSSNPAIAAVSATGNPATITRQGTQSGTVTITATITRSCGSPVVFSKTLTVGSPSFPYSVTGASPANPSGGYTYSLVTTPSDKPVSNIVWTVPSGWSITLGQGTRNLKVRTGTASGNVQVSFDDACGTNWGTYKFVTIGAGGPDPDAVDPGTMSLTVSPNPVSTTLKVSLNNTSNSITAKSITGNMQSIRVIIITDPMGSVRKRLHYDSGMQSATIDVAELHTGIYFIRVFDGAGWRYKQVLIAK
jgi:hypothetical protein